MVIAYTGDKGEPEAVASGASPSFAADLTEIMAWVQAGRSFRKVATIAALDAATGMADNDIALVDNVDGAWFRYDSSSGDWTMFGVAEFADSAARTTAIPSPVAGMWTRIAANVTYKYSGSAWRAQNSDWISYTPTLTNVAIGTGGSAANVSAYRYVNSRVQVRAELTLGTSGASLTGIPAISLPVNAAALEYTTELYPSFGSSINDASTVQTYFTGVGAVASSVTEARMLLIGSNGIFGAMSATVPYTWAAGDKLVYLFDYEPA